MKLTVASIVTVLQVLRRSNMALEVGFRRGGTGFGSRCEPSSRIALLHPLNVTTHSSYVTLSTPSCYSGVVCSIVQLCLILCYNRRYVPFCTWQAPPLPRPTVSSRGSFLLMFVASKHIILVGHMWHVIRARTGRNAKGTLQLLWCPH